MRALCKSIVFVAFIGISILLVVGILIVTAPAKSHLSDTTTVPEPISSSPSPVPNAEIVSSRPTRMVTANYGLSLLPTDAEDWALDGSWQVVRVERHGAVANQDEAMDFQMVFNQGELAVKSVSGKWDECRLEFSLVPNSTGLIDIVSKSANASPMACIYAIEKDQLKICDPVGDTTNRPNDFNTAEGDGFRLVVFQRTPPSAGMKEFWSNNGKAHLANNEFWKEFQTAKSKDEKDRAKASLGAKFEKFAERCLEIAETHPNTIAGVAALGWAATNASDTETGHKAYSILNQQIPTVDFDILGQGIYHAQLRSAKLDGLVTAILERVKTNPKHSQSARLLNTVCLLSQDSENAEPSTTFVQAADMILLHHPDAPGIENFCEILGSAKSTVKRSVVKSANFLDSLVISRSLDQDLALGQ